MEKIYIPLGLDCSVAYQLSKHNHRQFALPFDWIYSKNILSIIKLINNKFSNFLPNESNLTKLNEIYEIIKINTNNFNLHNPNKNINKFSKYKLKHKEYNIILPHEFEIINDKTIQFFIDKYKRRIDRFYELNNFELIFIRLGTIKDIQYLDLLEKTINKIFINNINKIKFINCLKLEKTITWKRDEYDWIEIFTNHLSYL